MDGEDPQAIGLLDKVSRVYEKYKFPISVFFFLFHVMDVASDVTMCFMLHRGGGFQYTVRFIIY